MSEEQPKQQPAPEQKTRGPPKVPSPFPQYPNPSQKMQLGHQLLLGDEILQKLRLLDYEKKFLKEKQINLNIINNFESGLKPISEAYFAIAANPNDQFNYFKLLVAWLFELNDSNVGDYASYDDPISVASNIQFELKKMGIECDFPPIKLKSGSGEHIVTVLKKLVDKTLKNQQFSFKKPKFKKEKEAHVEEKDMDDKDEGEGILDEVIGGDSDDNELSEGFEMDNNDNEDDEDKFAREIMHTKIEEKDWKIECEMALGRLKVRQNRQGREWRGHIEQTKKYMADIKKIMPTVQTTIQKKTDNLSMVLEKISKRERSINEQMSQKGIQYQDQAQDERITQNQYDMQMQKNRELEDKLRLIHERLEEVQIKIDQSGASVTDSTPVIKIKNAIETLQKEIQNMDVRIGILRHSVMQFKYKQIRYEMEQSLDGNMENVGGLGGLGLEEL